MENSFIEQNFFQTANDLDYSKLTEALRCLDTQDKISLIFLLVEDTSESLSLVNKSLTNNDFCPIRKWFNCCQVNSREILLLESLLLIQNFKVIEILGFNKLDVLNIFPSKIDCKTFAVSPIRKILFRVCDSLSPAESKDFIELLGIKTCTDDTSPIYLEQDLLGWIMSNSINITEPKNIDKLILALKSIGKLSEASWMESVVREVSAGSSAAESTSYENIDQYFIKDYYEILDEKNVGICIIINEQNFSNETGSQCNLHDRKGSEADCITLEETMKTFHIKTFTISNISSHQIIPNIKETVEKEFNEKIHSVLFIVILSHGDKGRVFGVDGNAIAIELIQDSFLMLPMIKKKPKVLIIQACQGRYFYQTTDSCLETDDSVCTETVKDLLICTATVEGFKAIRDIEKGSWYIQTLCETMRKFSREDFVKVLTKVTEKVEKKTVLPLPSGKRIAMLPHFDSRLTKSLFLYRKKAISNKTTKTQMQKNI